MDKSKADIVYQQTDLRLRRILSADDAVIRGQLANIRRGAGRKPGDDPRVWGILFDELPENILGRNGEPSREEWAIHIALTMYALHQQGNDPRQHSMNQSNISLGGAAGRLVAMTGNDDDARERVARRFHQVVLAPDMMTMSYYLRTFIQLLRASDIGLDYPKLAKDLYVYQLPDGAASVRLQWGQDFYQKNTVADNGKED